MLPVLAALSFETRTATTRYSASSIRFPIFWRRHFGLCANAEASQECRKLSLRLCQLVLKYLMFKVRLLVTQT